MAKVCPDKCLFAEECSYAFGDGPYPEDCDAAYARNHGPSHLTERRTTDGER